MKQNSSCKFFYHILLAHIDTRTSVWVLALYLFSLIVKSRSNLFLEPTSTKQ